MRKVFAGLCALTFVAALGAPLLAASETITGKVVDQTCYSKDKANNAGVDHKMPAETKDCAIACAKMGMPLALLTKDGKVYEIAGSLADNKNAKLVPYVGQTVSITGDTMSMPQGKMMIHGSEVKVVKE